MSKQYRTNLIFWVILVLVNLPVIAQITSLDVDNLVDVDQMRYFSFNKENKGSIKKVEAEKELTFLVSTDVHLEKQYALSKGIPLLPRNIKSGEKLLIAFSAKTTFASLETDEAKVIWQLNISDDRKERIRNVISIGGNWQKYYIPIEVGRSISKKDLALNVQFGFPPQKFLIKDIGFYVFDESTPLSDLPKTQITYAGMEAEAAWRQAAKTRIEKHRKGDFSIQITQNGKALEDVGIDVQMIRHHFDWGIAVNAKKIINAEKEQEKLSEAFNLVVFENDLKIKFWDRRIPKSLILEAIDQLRKKGFGIKGHVLIWPGFNHLSPEFKQHKNDPDKIEKMMADHLEDILSATAGKVDRWDVVNEAYSNQDLQKVTEGEQILYSGFTKLKKEYPKVKRFTNEFGIINKGGLNSKKQQWYYDFIQRIDDKTNQSVDGIGIQSHIGTDLTSPEKVYQLLDYYAKLGKSISISEFTMDVQDSIIRQIYTEDFLTIAFSHPAVTEFLFWGYKGDLKSKVDIFNEDGSLGSMGKAFYGLVHNLWTTSFSTTTDSFGKIEDRGFYGTYEYSYRLNNELRKGKFKLLPGQPTVINLDLP